MTTQMRAFTLFSAMFAVVYVVCVEMNLALFTYHPRLGQWDIGTVPARTGPAMYWFGWLASAGLAAALATLQSNCAGCHKAYRVAAPPRPAP